MRPHLIVIKDEWYTTVQCVGDMDSIQDGAVFVEQRAEPMLCSQYCGAD